MLNLFAQHLRPSSTSHWKRAKVFELRHERVNAECCDARGVTGIRGALNLMATVSYSSSPMNDTRHDPTT
jgi:hypothetical protein